MIKDTIKKSIRTIKEKGLFEFSRRLFFYAGHFLLYFSMYPYALSKMKKLNNLSLEELVHAAFNDFGGLIWPSQIRSEILELLKILDEKKPNTILEIGTARGGTLFLFSRIASENSNIFSIDNGIYSKYKKPLYEAFALPNQKIHLIREDSHKKETLKNILSELNGKKLDFLFIDGDHSYEGVKKDFEMYGKLVGDGGIIAFHDINPDPSQNTANKFWLEIKDSYKHREIGNQSIGILYV